MESTNQPTRNRTYRLNKEATMYLKSICLSLSLGILAACSEHTTESEPAAEIVPYNQGTFTNQPFAGGSITDGLDINKIEYQHHQRFDRFIFSISHWQGAGENLAGKPANNLGHHELIIANKNELQLFLSGYRGLSASFPHQEDKAATVISRLRGEEYEDDSTVAILFSSQHTQNCHRITEDKQQSVLIVDVKQC